MTSGKRFRERSPPGFVEDEGKVAPGLGILGAELADATMVREGEGPRYGETSDSARKGAEGDAE